MHRLNFVGLSKSSSLDIPEGWPCTIFLYSRGLLRMLYLILFLWFQDHFQGRKGQIKSQVSENMIFSKKMLWTCIVALFSWNFDRKSIYSIILVIDEHLQVQMVNSKIKSIKKINIHN